MRSPPSFLLLLLVVALALLASSANAFAQISKEDAVVCGKKNPDVVQAIGSFCQRAPYVSSCSLVSTLTRERGGETQVMKMARQKGRGRCTLRTESDQEADTAQTKTERPKPRFTHRPLFQEHNVCRQDKRYARALTYPSLSLSLSLSLSIPYIHLSTINKCHTYILSLNKYTGNCDPTEKITKEWCFRQFYNICRNGNKNGSGVGRYGGGGCQRWVILEKDHRLPS
jgi:hypothetical protein